MRTVRMTIEVRADIQYTNGRFDGQTVRDGYRARCESFLAAVLLYRQLARAKRSREVIAKCYRIVSQPRIRGY
jgi:hypothetical protein